ncbi:unnamed protein product, partial [Ectocarpus sp. 8 AP-2014]
TGKRSGQRRCTKPGGGGEIIAYCCWSGRRRWGWRVRSRFRRRRRRPGIVGTGGGSSVASVFQAFAYTAAVSPQPGLYRCRQPAAAAAAAVGGRLSPAYPDAIAAGDTTATGTASFLRDRNNRGRLDARVAGVPGPPAARLSPAPVPCLLRRQTPGREHFRPRSGRPPPPLLLQRRRRWCGGRVGRAREAAQRQRRR